MHRREPRFQPVFWLAMALFVLPSAPGRASPIQMTISGTIGNSEFFSNTITPQTITLPNGLSSASSLGSIILANSKVSDETAKVGLPADRLSAGYSYTESSPFDIHLTFQTPGSSTTSADSATINLTGTSTMTFNVKNGQESFSVSLPSELNGSITTAPGSGSSIPLSLLTQFTSVPFELSGSMTSVMCGNDFKLSLSFAGAQTIGSGPSGPSETPTPEPGALLVFGAGSLVAWIARSRRLTPRSPPGR
jgi:PEP-CTERM motif